VERVNHAGLVGPGPRSGTAGERSRYSPVKPCERLHRNTYSAHCTIQVGNNLLQEKL
jgi:hypothetical protein